jgi:hypothetical protein
MGQAKFRKAEIDELKAKGPKVKPTLDGYRPDAGLNSPAFIESHYWVSVTEYVSELHGVMSKGIQPRAYNMSGTKYIELNFSSDIMDIDGNEHIQPQTDSGYYATVRFTIDQMKDLANEIRKGAMTLRITGIPCGQVEKSPAGESFMVINCVSSWSPGNDSGHMTYMWMNNGGMSKSDSNRLAETLDGFAEQLANFD